MFRPLFLNLRGVTITSGAELLEYLHSRSLMSSVDRAWKPFVDTCSAAIRRIKLSGTLRLTGEANLALDQTGPGNMQSRRSILDELVDALPNWIEMDGIPFVLIVDEANRLLTLAQSDPSVRLMLRLSLVSALTKFKQAFQDFMQFVIRASKEQRKLHVIFTSSDSLFDKQLVGNGK